MKKILFIRHIATEGPGTLGDYLVKKSVPHEILDVYKDGGACPEKSSNPSGDDFRDKSTRNFSEISGCLKTLDWAGVASVVILGGPMNVTEEAKYPFLAVEKTFIREAAGRKVPLLGICLGAQLIAVSFGAQVRRAPKKEIGWFDVALEKSAQEDALTAGLPRLLRVFQWHEDTFDLPASSLLLAKAGGMNQMFCYKNIAWGLQFHLEINRELIDLWCQDHLAEAGFKSRWQEMRQEYVTIKESYGEQARVFYEAFLKKSGF